MFADNKNTDCNFLSQTKETGILLLVLSKVYTRLDKRATLTLINK